MKDVDFIVRFEQYSKRVGDKLGRVEGIALADSVIALIDNADLEANPRKAKANLVTQGILASLSETPEIHHYKTRGSLIAAASCEQLQRNRFRLHFDDPVLQGVLDGGHNLLATAMYIIEACTEKGEQALRGKKSWDDVMLVWRELRSEIEANKEILDFRMPLEIIYPHDDEGGRAAFDDAILDISQARNANVQLSPETKANKKGIYDKLKEALPTKVADNVQWKTNDGGRIKVADVVALAMIPLDRLQSATEDKNLELNGFTPVSIYRYKTGCVKAFNELIERGSISKEINGPILEIHHPAVLSALTIAGEFPELYDRVYTQFPAAYNKHSQRFGGIRSVRVYDPAKYAENKDKYTNKQPLTKFTQQPCTYDYPEGFVAPIVYALGQLLEWDGQQLTWSIDPHQFVDNHLEHITGTYLGIIRMVDYDPQRVGKGTATYDMLASLVRERMGVSK